MARYNNVNVKLAGTDGNAFSILGKVVSAMKRAGLTKDQIEEYKTEAKSGDYDNLLCVTMDYVCCS